MCVYVRTNFQVSSIILTSFRPEVILSNPPPPQNEPLKTPPRLKLTQKLFPTDIVHVSNTIYLCISPSVDGQLVELTYQPFITNWGKVLLQIWAALFYYKLEQVLLQIGAAQLLQNGADVITNWGNYYKLGQPLLQNGAAITNCGKRYYKLGQLLQIGEIITNRGIAESSIIRMSSGRQMKQKERDGSRQSSDAFQS